MKRKKLSDKLRENLSEYTSRSSIHGVSYTADQALPRADRLLWLLLFLAAVGLAGYIISRFLMEWQEDPTITTLDSLAAPIEGTNQPALRWG